MFLRLSVYLVCFVLVACQAPPVRMQDTSGSSHSFAGKWTLINYWASWCAPCQQEIPELNRFYARHLAGKVQLVGVNFDNTKNLEQLKAIIKSAGVQFPTLTEDPAAQLGINDIPGVPYTLIVSPEGKVQQRLAGPQTVASLERMQSSLDYLKE